MAPFAFDPLDEEQKKKAEAEQAAAGGAAPAMTGGGSTFSGGGSGAAMPSGDKGAARQGSGFVGLDKYMAANKGNDFGGQVTGKVQGSVNAAKGTLGQGASEFANASNQGTTRWGDVGNEAKGLIDSAGDQTTKENASRIQGLESAKYQGPDSFAGSAFGTQAGGAVQKATQQANALQSEGGRFALLDQYYGRPNYNSGQKSLDNLLVQNAPGVAARSQSIGGQAKTLAANAGQTGQDMNNLATANRAATDDTAKQTRDYLGNAVTGFQSGLDNRYKDFQNQAGAYNKSLYDDASDDVLGDDASKAFGVNYGTPLFDTKLSNYIQENPQGTKNEFATDADYAKYLALSQLSGEDPTYLQAGDRAKAGTAASGQNTVDQARLKGDLATKKAAAVNALQSGSPETAALMSDSAKAQIRDAYNLVAGGQWGKPSGGVPSSEDTADSAAFLLNRLGGPGADTSHMDAKQKQAYSALMNALEGGWSRQLGSTLTGTGLVKKHVASG